MGSSDPLAFRFKPEDVAFLVVAVVQEQNASGTPIADLLTGLELDQLFLRTVSGSSSRSERTRRARLPPHRLLASPEVGIQEVLQRAGITPSDLRLCLEEYCQKPSPGQPPRALPSTLSERLRSIIGVLDRRS